MSSVEAAASLFDSGDLASDPFATLSNNDADTTPDGGNNFTSTDVFPEDAGFLDTNSSSFGDEPTPSTWSYATTHEQPTHHNFYATDVHASSVNQVQQQQLYDPDTQWQNHDESSQEWNGSAYALPQPQQSTQNSYDPYAVTGHMHAPAYPERGRDNFVDPPASSYAPDTQTPSSYAPVPFVPAPYAQSQYDPYQSRVSGDRAVTESSIYPPTPYHAPTQAIPPPALPPPAPIAAINRPKTANAYDPPLVPAKSRRLPASRAPSQQPYDPYGAYSSSPNPPVRPQQVHPPPPQGQTSLGPSPYSAPSNVGPPVAPRRSTPVAPSEAMVGTHGGNMDYRRAGAGANLGGSIPQNAQQLRDHPGIGWSEPPVAGAAPRENHIDAGTRTHRTSSMTSARPQSAQRGRTESVSREHETEGWDPENAVADQYNSLGGDSLRGPQEAASPDTMSHAPHFEIPTQARQDNSIEGRASSGSGPTLSSSRTISPPQAASSPPTLYRAQPWESSTLALEDSTAPKTAASPPPRPSAADGTSLASATSANISRPTYPYDQQLQQSSSPASAPIQRLNDPYTPVHGKVAPAISQPHDLKYFPNRMLSPGEIYTNTHGGPEADASGRHSPGPHESLVPSATQRGASPVSVDAVNRLRNDGHSHAPLVGTVDPYHPATNNATAQQAYAPTWHSPYAPAGGSYAQTSYTLDGDPYRAATGRDSDPMPSTLSTNGSMLASHNHRMLPTGTIAAEPTSEFRPRSMSNTSAVSAYGPSGHVQRSSETSEYGVNSFRNEHSEATSTDPYRVTPLSPQTSMIQEMLVPAHINMPYAPSPSLLGLNDPLGRHLARVPVITFGFGGKMVTCFHRPSDLSTGFDVALSSRKCTEVHIRVLHKCIPESALDASAASFPGPLYMDPAMSTTSLVRTGATAQVKSKKASVVKYLSERADELSRAIGYLHHGSAGKRTAEGKLVLVNLLKVMVENDGHLSGSATIDTAVRAALLPRLNFAARSTPESSLLTPALGSTGFPSGSELHPANTDSPSAYLTTAGVSSTDPHDAPISVSTLRPAALDKIQELLVRGERRKAYQFALDQKLWAHAMVIASSIDKDAWTEVTAEFLKTELGLKQDSRHGAGVDATRKGRGPLRAAYSLYSGQGVAAVQELAAPFSTTPNLQAQSLHHPAPAVSSGFSPSATVKVAPDSLAGWPETAAMMLSSPLTPDASAALTALGDCLLSNEWVEAAHACYLLAPQTSPVGGVGNSSTRVVLLGSPSPQSVPNFYKDPDSIIFTEILEFAHSLAPIVKGQDPFNGLPHLQAYRLLRATSLMELGHIKLAGRYCEAITGSLGRLSPYFNAVFLEQLQGIAERMHGAPSLDKSGSWIAGKMTKPSLDSIGNWLEGRFTKLITGDGDTSPSSSDDAVQRDQRTFSGPFSHYSTISSTTSSACPSPQASMVNLHASPPRRSGSAMGVASTPVNHNIERASSAMDHLRRKPSPAPRTGPAPPAGATFGSMGHAANGYSPNPVHSDQDSTTTPTLDGASKSMSWWGSSYNTESAVATPIASTFSPFKDTAQLLEPPMDQAASNVPTARDTQGSQQSYDDIEDDLGLGNSKSKVANGKAENAAAVETAASQPAQKQKAPDAATGSWLSRWWKKSDTPAPVRANLGEETTFYYDKEQKRWVNKSTGSQPEKSAVAPPPPSRAQTASPGRSKPPTSDNSSRAPPRSASAVNLSSSPPLSRSGPRARSNLVPPTEAESESSSPSMLGTGPPPPGRPKSQASKRNIRNRYVDVFQPQDS